MKHVYITNCIADGGIYHYKMIDGKLCFADKLPLEKPMYTVFENGRFYTLLRETDAKTHFGAVVSGYIGNDGKLTLSDKMYSSNGICPCHLCVAQERIFITNYLSGNVVRVPDITVTHTGKGVNAERQEAPHTHCIIPSKDGKYLLSADLGLDTVFVYDTNLNEISKSAVPSGKGCRHLVFSDDGKYLYCVNELSSDVSVFAYADGHLDYLKTYSCNLPNGAQTTAAAIRFSNGRLYVSHRGADCVSVFDADGETLRFVCNVASGGNAPRDIFVFDNTVITANEGGTVGVIDLSGDNAVLKDIYNLSGDPLCVNYIDL